MLHSRVRWSSDDNGGGGSDNRLREARDEAQAERQKRQELERLLGERDAKIVELTKSAESLMRKLEKSEGTLGAYVSKEKRLGAIEKAAAAILEKHKAEGKQVELKTDKALKWLERGAFNAETLEAEAAEAVAEYGEIRVIPQPNMGLKGQAPAGGDGDNKPKIDPMDQALLNALGRR